VGTSAGVGLERGYCMMVGGDKDAVDHINPILAPARARHHPAARQRMENEGEDPRAEQGTSMPGRRVGALRQDGP